MGLGLLRHRTGGTLKLGNGFRILPKRQQADAQKQSRRSIRRLESDRLAKSADRQDVVATLLGDDTEIMED